MPTAPKLTYFAWLGTLLLTLSLVIGAYAFRIGDYPKPDFDEKGILLIPYRVVHFADDKLLTAYTEDFNGAVVRKYPLPLCGISRNAFHLACGFSDVKSRLFSASLCLIAIVCLVAAAWRVFRLRWLLIPAYLALACSPSVFTAARAVRFEQEVLSLGVIATFAPFVLLRPNASTSYKLVVWSLAGLLAGLAAVSHPWGIVFSILLGLTLLLDRASWSQLDGLSTGRRLLAWGAGLAVPAIYTIAFVFSDLANFRHFYQVFKPWYAARDIQNSGVFSAYWPELKTFLPLRLVAQLASMRVGAIFQPLDPRWKPWFEGLFALQILTAAAFGAGLLNPKAAVDRLLVKLGCLLPIAFVAFGFMYLPTWNYYPYWSFTASAALVLVLLFSFAKTKLPLKYVFGASLSLLAVVSAGYVVRTDYLAAKTALHDSAPSLDTDIAALQMLGSDARLDPSKNVYSDFLSWPACGKNVRSLLDVMVLQPGRAAVNAGAVAFEGSCSEGTLELPSYGSPPASVETKIASLSKLVSDMHLAGAYLNGAHDFYVLKNGEHDSLMPEILVWQNRALKKFAVDWKTLQRPTFDESVGKPVWKALAPGSYIVSTTVSKGSSVKISDAKSGKVLTSAPVRRIDSVVPHLLLLQIDSPSTDAVVTVSGDDSDWHKLAIAPMQAI